MATNKFDLRRFFADPTAVAAVVSAGHMFGPLSRRVDLPPGVAALVTRRPGQQEVVLPGGQVVGDKATEILLVRSTPVKLTWTEDSITSADHFQAAAAVEMQVAPIAERGELLGFREHILGSGRKADTETLVRYLRSSVRAGLTRCAEQRKMDVLVDAKDRQAVSEAVAAAAAGPCFEAGLAGDVSPNVEFSSPTFAQVRRAREQSARQRQEQAAERQLETALEAAQGAHLRHLEGLLGQLKTLASESPGVDLSDLIRTFSEAQRGEVYEALFAASAGEPVTQWIVVAAGNELLFYDPASAEAPSRRVPLDGQVGAVRSVQSARGADGGQRLLAGAARGVYEVMAEGDAPATVYAFGDDVEVRGGVNSVALAGDYVLATHSEVGLARWLRGEPARCERLLEHLTRGAQAVRGVRFFNGKVCFSVDEKVVVADADRLSEPNVRVHTGSDSVITALCWAPDGIYAGNAQGQVLYWPHEGGVGVQIIHSGSRRPAESLHVLTAGGISRIFFTDTTLAVHARVIGDSFACRYEAGGQTLRRVEVAPDLVAATNELRDRLILWKPAVPAIPAGTISVARQTGHHIQDVCLLPIG